MNKKIIALTAAGLLAISLSGCAKSTVESNTTTPTSQSSTVFGKVTNIDGSTITIDVGSMSAPSDQHDFTAGDGSSDATQPVMPSGNPDGMGQQMPDGSAPQAGGENGAAPSGFPSGAPSGDQAGPADGNNADAPFENHGGPGGFSGFEATGEIQSITVSSSTVITLGAENGQATGSISDIAVGDIIMATMDGTTASAITVMGNNVGGTPDGGSNSASDAESSTDSSDTSSSNE